jgi:serine/threonine protein kinase
VLRRDVVHLVREAARAEAEGFLDPGVERGEREGGEEVGAGVRTPRVGDRIGAYELTDVLGMGGIGVVYRARQGSPIVREVAVKVLHRSRASSREMFRFEAERRAAASLDHPGIARVLDAGVDARFGAYTVFECVPGRAITEFAREGGLDWRARVGLVLEACEALQHAHQRGVIHRDLKPENLLAYEQDGRAWVKVVDFGSARLTREAARITGDGEGVPGTLAYMSPEQLRGEYVPDTRSDVYALGVILYELLAGSLPWRDGGVPVLEAMTRIGRDELPALAEPSGVVGRDLTSVCRCACAAEAGRRYATMEQLAEDLRHVLAGEAVRARRASALERVVRSARRHWRVLAAGAAVLAVCVGLTGWALRARAVAAENREELAQTLQGVNDGVMRQLSLLSGVSETRRRIATTLLTPLERLEASGRGDARSRVALAAVLGELGNLDEHDARLEAARVRWKHAERLLRRAAGELPEDIEVLRKHAEAVVRVGDTTYHLARQRVTDDRALMADPEMRRVEALYREALAIQLHALTLSPNHAGVLDDISYSFSRLGHLALLAQEFEEAESLLRQRVELSVRLAEENPDRVIHRYGLSNARTQLALFLRDQGMISDAVTLTRLAIEDAEAILRVEPSRFGFQLQEVSAYALLVLCLQSAGREEEAARWGRVGYEKYMALERSNPKWTPMESWRVDLRKAAGLDGDEAAEMGGSEAPTGEAR